jgi:hypothetical protein
MFVNLDNISPECTHTKVPNKASKLCAQRFSLLGWQEIMIYVMTLRNEKAIILPSSSQRFDITSGDIMQFMLDDGCGLCTHMLEDSGSSLHIYIKYVLILFQLDTSISIKYPFEL